MIQHVSYREEHFVSADACLEAIREHLDRGWRVSQICGPQYGPFVVLFRMDDDI